MKENEMNDFTKKIKSVILPYLTALKNHLDTLNLRSRFVFDATFWEEEFIKTHNYFRQLKQNLPKVFEDFTLRNLPPKESQAIGDHDAYTALQMAKLQKDVNLAISLLKSYLTDVANREKEGTLQKKVLSSKVFISHGPPTSVLDRVTKFLRDDLGLIPIVAEWTASEGRDIRPDVEEKMRECACAIILAEIDPDNPTGNKTRENVLIEAEHARMAIGKLVWLKQKGVVLPSFDKSTIWEEFTPDCLEKAFAKIVRELGAFGLLR